MQTRLGQLLLFAFLLHQRFNLGGLSSNLRAAQGHVLGGLLLTHALDLHLMLLLLGMAKLAAQMARLLLCRTQRLIQCMNLFGQQVALYG